MDWMIAILSWVELSLLERMAGTTRLELATSAVTGHQPEVTVCNFKAPIAPLGALRNPLELFLHPNCIQILAQSSPKILRDSL
jgi:hypothetical protein